MLTTPGAEAFTTGEKDSMTCGLLCGTATCAKTGAANAISAAAATAIAIAIAAARRRCMASFLLR
jgi:hypothetical protein